ncbi:DNA-binding helix-turn-helix protein [Treponema socranskii subsp. socranskii VPI DR56BR1116 = ATCC 35536]|uniref:DNA-binding helix-turn-helix protein n=1 Tax=Treponema socranskii subsp. socranskii VPI DR56BR1116 = ATCC 35536 TaxID=1125725 RepID=A0ABN0P7H2_TRESO|nr:DNA-binding helix-turn-helix protein [Treponema socranskii subsp. socranskii VPI DR56BR1116 = ATCC 35536]
MQFYQENIPLEELNIGKKIQELRLQKGFTMRKLALKADITASMLSQIENGQVNPSINTLRSIAEVLETPLYCFFREEFRPEPLVTPATRKTIGRKDKPDVVYELLTADTKGNIEFCMMVIPPYTSSNTDRQSHLGEETAFMYSGEKVDLDVEGTFFELHPGDSIRIPAQAKHVWHNKTDMKVQVIFAVTPPSF